MVKYIPSTSGILWKPWAPGVFWGERQAILSGGLPTKDLVLNGMVPGRRKPVSLCSPGDHNCTTAPLKDGAKDGSWASTTSSEKRKLSQREVMEGTAQHWLNSKGQSTSRDVLQQVPWTPARTAQQSPEPGAASELWVVAAWVRFILKRWDLQVFQSSRCRIE